MADPHGTAVSQLLMSIRFNVFINLSISWGISYFGGSI